MESQISICTFINVLLDFMSKWGIGLKTMRMSTNREMMHGVGLGRMEENYLTIPTILQKERHTAKKARAQYCKIGRSAPKPLQHQFDIYFE